MIKFRAWDKEEKEMIYDVQNTYDFTCNGSGAMEPSLKDVLEDKDRYEVMQFVNLHDFEDKELYTGDISRDEKGRVYVVYYSEGGFCMCLANGSGVGGGGGRRFRFLLCRAGGGPVSQLLFPVRFRSRIARAVWCSGPIKPSRIRNTRMVNLSLVMGRSRATTRFWRFAMSQIPAISLV